MAHYKAQYESPSLGSKWELPCPMIKLLDGGHGGVVAHGITGFKETKILAYVSTAKPTQQTLYFSRVSNLHCASFALIVAVYSGCNAFKKGGIPHWIQ